MSLRRPEVTTDIRYVLDGDKLFVEFGIRGLTEVGGDVSIRMGFDALPEPLLASDVRKIVLECFAAILEIWDGK